MDSIINACLEEICSQLQNGLPILSLWPRIQPFLASSNLNLSPSVKKAIWNNLLTIPSLRFEIKNKECSSKDPFVHSFENAEKLNVKIVSVRNLSDNFIGLYESNSLVPNQMRILELLANARFDTLLIFLSKVLCFFRFWAFFVCDLACACVKGV